MNKHQQRPSLRNNPLTESTMHLSEFKKARRIRAPSAILYFLLATALLSLPHPIFVRTPTPPCGRIVLISAARHGSTWFVDSAEGCTAENGSFGDLNAVTELWNLGQNGPLRYIEPRMAALYARDNHSVKLFPTSMQRSSGDIIEFLKGVKEFGLPVFLLRRSLEDSYGSLAVALEKGIWNAASNSSDVGKERKVVVKDDKWERYCERINRFFVTIEGMMKELGMVWDEFWYDEVVKTDLIVGQRNQCSVKNCNFRR